MLEHTHEKTSPEYSVGAGPHSRLGDGLLRPDCCRSDNPLVDLDVSISSPCASSLVPCDMIEKWSSPSTPVEHHIERHELIADVMSLACTSSIVPLN